ncbi:MAG: transglutaminase-like domain-containing protein [Actinomycetia bacterium]|nr:transglutaminase-like domain-containing protein [Actinomycetes bacterium]
MRRGPQVNVLDWIDDQRDRLAERVARLRGADPVPVRRRSRAATATLFQESPAGRRLWLGTDLAAIAALLVLLTWAWLPTYGGGWTWVASLGSGLLGVVVGVVATLRRWNTVVTTAVALVGYLLLGTLLAMPSAGYAWVVPTWRSLQGLLVAPVSGWKRMLTVTPPIGETADLLVPVVLVGLVSVLAAVTVALRSGYPTWAWVPMVAGTGLAFGLGVSTSYAPVPAGLATLALVLVWTTYRRSRQSRTLLLGRHWLRWTSLATGLAMLGLASGAVLLARPLLEPAQERRTVRALVRQPLDIHRYPSPLQAFRRNITDFKTETILTAKGAPAGSRVRLGTMDAYDGFTYNVSNTTAYGRDSGTFGKIGARVDDPTPGTEVDVEVTLGKLSGVWVPTVGQTLRVDFTGPRGVGLADAFYYNQRSGTGLAPVTVGEGDQYRLRAVVPRQPSREQIMTAAPDTVGQPPAEPLPDVVRDTAGAWAALAPSGGGALALAYTEQLKKGYYSHGQPDEVRSDPGHSVARLEALFRNTEQMVGDEEQYAVALALLCRAAGLPARVGYGYLVPAADGVVRGENVTAWTEVNLGQLGWVVFDPTPSKDRVLKLIEEEPVTAPRPQVENPPPPPVKPEVPEEDTSQQATPTPPQDQRLQINWRLIGTVAIVAGIPLVFVVLPICLIVGLKLRRRRMRMGDPDLSRRVAGGWAEVIDRARDLGVSPAVAGTRTEQAEQLVASFRRVTELADPRILSRQADMSVFSPERITAGQAQTYWTSVDAAVGGLNRSVGFWRRLQATLSVRSFRRRLPRR